ncbi:hypothetical protein PSTT_12687, partial [Puccinia striiformis]
SHNRQFISGASALGFLSAVETSLPKNIPRHEGLEPIWRRLGPYIDGLFIDSFLTPNCLFSFHQPQILQLAQAITSDFLCRSKTNSRHKISKFLGLLLSNEQLICVPSPKYQPCPEIYFVKSYHFPN